MLAFFAKEPLAVTATVTALLIVGVQFGLPITGDQQDAIRNLLSTLLGLAGLWVARNNVAAPRTLVKAGTTLDEVAELAGDSTRELRPVKVSAGWEPPKARPSWFPPTAVLVVLALASLAAACGGRSVTTTPDQAVTRLATYGTTAVNLATEVQTSVTAFASLQGGRTKETDAVSTLLRDEVLPAARTLNTRLQQYHAIRQVGGAVDITDVNSVTEALESYESAINAVLKSPLPEGLAKEVGVTVGEVTRLIQSIRRQLDRTATVSGNISLRLEPSVHG